MSHENTVRKAIAAGVAVAVLPLLTLSGCYTQFDTLDAYSGSRTRTTVEAVDTTGDTCSACDSARAVKPRGRVDTLVIKNPDREICYWTRDFWGEPYLKCVRSAYAREWYIYNDYPWWYRTDPYYYDYSGRCPRYYYYDVSCGCCRYYRYDRPYDYRYPRYYGGGGGWSGGGAGGGASSQAPGTVERRSPASQTRDGRSSGQVHSATSGQTPKLQSNAQTSEQSQQQSPTPVAAPSDAGAAPASAPANHAPMETIGVDTADASSLPAKPRRSVRSR